MRSLEARRESDVERVIKLARRWGSREADLLRIKPVRAGSSSPVGPTAAAVRDEGM